MAKVAKLKITNPTNVDWKVLRNITNDMNYTAWKIKNRTVTRYHELIQKELEYNATHDDNMNAGKRKELYGYKTYDSLIYSELKDDYTYYGFHSEIVPSLIREAVQAYKKVQKDVMRGNAVIPTFKRGQPIPIRSRQMKILDRHSIQFIVLNKVGGESYNVERTGGTYPITVKVASKNNHARIVMDRLLSGRYTLSDSRLEIAGKDMYIQLVYKDTETKQVAVDKDTILGIDLGITNAVTMSVSDSKRYEIIDGGEIESFRQRTEKRRKSLQNQLKYCSDNRRGHGRKALLKPLEKVKSKIANFRELTNHRYSKFIVETAIENGCGTIQFEDLSGIKYTSNFLSNWSYYDLQTKTANKAKEVGIDIVMIKPDYTSQRCNKCGVIDADSRPTQETFKCTTCDHTTNADINASRNIAIKGIEKIIEKQLKAQEKTKV